MDMIEPYEQDFVGWTERQAELLRALPPGTHGLDTANLAEEIESLGRAEIKETSSLLRQRLVHLVKLAVQPDAPPALHWVEEALTVQGDAVLACTSGIRQRIDLPNVWRLAGNASAKALASHGVLLRKLPAECPLTLDQLLREDFDPREAAAVVGRSIGKP